MSIETLASELGDVPDEVLEEALDELNDGGIVEYDERNGYLSPRHALFWHTDPVVKGWSPKEDARICAEMLVREEENMVDMPYLSEKTGWAPRRLNVAASYLSEHELICAVTAMGTAPWAYYQLNATVKTRRFLKDKQ
jgi:hypothetical protein